MKAFKIFLSCLILFTGVQDLLAQNEIIDISVKDYLDLAEHNKTIQLIDVRTPQEIALGQIEGAKNIVWDSNFAAKLSSLDKAEPVVLYCRSGNRSAKAANVLLLQGFQKIYNLKGGYIAFKSQEHQ